MRAAIASLSLGLLCACEGSESATLELDLAAPDCDRRNCVTVLEGQGIYVISAEPTSSDALANEAGMLTFFGETRTSSGTTVVVELAFKDDGTPSRARYREIGDGDVRFKAEIRDLEAKPSAEGRRFSFTAVNRDDPKDVRLVQGRISTIGVIVPVDDPVDPSAPDNNEPDDTGCGGTDDDDDNVNIYWPPPTHPTPPPTTPTPDPSPDPEMPVSSSDGCSGDPGPSEPSTPDSSSGCEGDTSTPSSSSSCEGDSSSSSSSSCEGDTSSSSSSCEGGSGSSASSSCSGCEGDVAAASCVPMLPWDRILGSLFRMFGPVSLVGWWNRRRRS